jgi:hypothetical protein
MAKQLTELQRYALLGAQARLQQLAEETANIYRTFPQLRGRNGVAAKTTSGELGAPAAKRRRGRMSAAQRKAVGARMKKYWAAKRAAATGAATGKKSPSADTPKAVSKRGRTAKRTKATGKRGARKMSAAARKRISDAQKARWAKRKGAAA